MIRFGVECFINDIAQGICFRTLDLIVLVVLLGLGLLLLVWQLVVLLPVVL